MTALLDGRMRREATVAGEPALEITIFADLSKLPTTSPWLSDWLSAAWCPGNLWDRCDYFTNKTGADARTRTADLLITNQLLYQLSYAGKLMAGSYASQLPLREILPRLPPKRWTQHLGLRACEEPHSRSCP